MENRRILVDTGPFIEYIRLKDKSKATILNLPASAELFMSAITWYELWAGTHNESTKSDLLVITAGIPIIAFETEMAELAGQIHRFLRRQGKMIGFRDILIAATALVHRLPVRTLNTKDFERIEGVVLV